MKLIKLVRRDFDDPFFGVIGEDHKLVSSDIDESDPLCERFSDTRTPYEQYCAGEKYLKYGEETLYSRAAHEWMLRKAEWYPQDHVNNRISLEKLTWLQNRAERRRMKEEERR